MGLQSSLLHSSPKCFYGSVLRPNSSRKVKRPYGRPLREELKLVHAPLHLVVRVFLKGTKNFPLDSGMLERFQFQ